MHVLGLADQGPHQPGVRDWFKEGHHAGWSTKG